MWKYLLISGVIILGIFYYLYNTNKELQKQLSISKINEKAYMERNGELASRNTVYQMTISQLNYSKDSIMQKMNTVRKELDIKNKDLKHLQYLLSEVKKIDTLVFKDTIFQEGVKIDSTIGDYWYSVRLKLDYPNTVVISPKFINEVFFAGFYKKETIDPPKKFFLLRWFQKKHIVVKVKVIEKNPYSENKEHIFVDIIK